MNCFNPYFTGSTTSTGASVRERAGKKIVSILILLEVPLQPYACCGKIRAERVFQSLFYWKYHFNKY